MIGLRRATIVIALTMLAAACAPDAVTTTIAPANVATTPTVTPTTAAPATTTAPPATVTTAAVTTSAAVTTTTSTTVPPPPPGAMLITNENGVYVATLDGVTSQVIAADPGGVDGTIALAVDDTRGGVIFQPKRDPWLFRGDDSIVYWSPSGSSGYQQLLVPGPGQGLALNDVVRQGDTTMVYYTRLAGSTPDDLAQTLRRFDLDAKTVTEVTTVGGWESGSDHISIAGDGIVTSGASEGFDWISFSDLDGTQFESPANPIPDGGFDCIPDCFYYGDLSPDGATVGFARLAPNGGGLPTIPEITVRRVATGDVLLDVMLPEMPAVAYIDSVDLSDEYLLVNLVEEGSEYPVAVIVDLASGGLTTYTAPVGGRARFVRSRPTLGGVVSWP